MPLQFADPKPADHLSILLYGPSGEGKSVAACSAPGPIVYCNADGPGALRYARKAHPTTELLELPVDGSRVLDELLIELSDGKLDGVKTVVLDPLGRIYDVLLEEKVRKRTPANQPLGAPTLPERGDVNQYLDRLILALRSQPVNLVLVAHDNPVKVSGNDDDGTDQVELMPYTGTNNPALGKKFIAAMDIVAYCGKKDVTNDDGSTSRTYVGQTTKGYGRHGKDRTDVLGDFPDLNLTAWIDAVTAAYAAPVTEKKEKAAA